jgi:hypothetical protein
MATTILTASALPSVRDVLGDFPARCRVSFRGSVPVHSLEFLRSTHPLVLSMPCRVAPVVCSCGMSVCSCPSFSLEIKGPPVLVWLPVPPVSPSPAPPRARFSFASSFVPVSSVVRARLSVSSFPCLVAALSAIHEAGPGCRVGVVGSREFPALGLVSLFVASLPAGCVVVSGAARGVDRAAASSARGRGLEVDEFRAAWSSSLGRAAGMLRNRELVSSCSVVVVFRALGASPGSDSDASLARSAGIPVFVVSPPALACPVVQPSLF